MLDLSQFENKRFSLGEASSILSKLLSECRRLQANNRELVEFDERLFDSCHDVDSLTCLSEQELSELFELIQKNKEA